MPLIYLYHVMPCYIRRFLCYEEKERQLIVVFRLGESGIT